MQNYRLFIQFQSNPLMLIQKYKKGGAIKIISTKKFTGELRFAEVCTYSQCMGRVSVGAMGVLTPSF